MLVSIPLSTGAVCLSSWRLSSAVYLLAELATHIVAACVDEGVVDVAALAESLSGQCLSACCGPIGPYEALFWHVLLLLLHKRANDQGTQAARGAGAAAVASVTDARACVDAADAITPHAADLLQLIEQHALAEVPNVAAAGHLIEVARVAIDFGDGAASNDAIALAAKLVPATAMMPCVPNLVWLFSTAIGKHPATLITSHACKQCRLHMNFIHGRHQLYAVNFQMSVMFPLGTAAVLVHVCACCASQDVPVRSMSTY